MCHHFFFTNVSKNLCRKGTDIVSFLNIFFYSIYNSNVIILNASNNIFSEEGFVFQNNIFHYEYQENSFI